MLSMRLRRRFLWYFGLRGGRVGPSMPKEDGVYESYFWDVLRTYLWVHYRMFVVITGHNRFFARLERRVESYKDWAVFVFGDVLKDIHAIYASGQLKLWKGGKEFTCPSI